MLCNVLLAFFLSSALTVNSSPINIKNPEEGELFEGDIAGIDPIKGAAQIPTLSRIKWPYGVVPYIIDAVYTKDQRNTVLSGLKLIEDLTRVNNGDCIRFVPRTIEETYIKVFSGSGCWSYVGRQNKTGEQEVSIEIPGCLTNAIVAHEFMHALGFWHEQSRPDRDEFVEVLYENIQTGKEHNFNKYSTNLVDFLGLPYDYDSVMHYSGTSFSKNGKPTMRPYKEDAQIGQRKTLSPTDIAEIRKFYNCV